MAKMQGLVDHPDILQQILICVAKSSDGAKYFARAISVCKAFRRFVDDRETLRAVSFNCLEINGRWKLFQLIEGLIWRCAKAGQEEAQFILGQIILSSTAEIINKGFSRSTQAKNASLSEEFTQVSHFLRSFVPGRIFPEFIGYHHIEFVNIFLSRASLLEFKEMEPCLSLYMNYVMFCKSCDYELREAYVKNSMCTLKIVCACEEKSITYSALARDVCLGFSQALQKWGVEKDELGGIELELDYNAHTTAVEKLDMVLKRLSDAKTIKERFHQLFSKQKSEVSCGILSVLEMFDVSSLIEVLRETRALVCDTQEKRRNLLSEFRTFFL